PWGPAHPLRRRLTFVHREHVPMDSASLPAQNSNLVKLTMLSRSFGKDPRVRQEDCSGDGVDADVKRAAAAAVDPAMSTLSTLALNQNLVAAGRSLAPLTSDEWRLVNVLAREIGEAKLPALGQRLKRGFDVLFAALALIALSPLLAAVALAVKLSSD